MTAPSSTSSHLSDDAVEVLRAFLAAYSEGLSASAKVALAAQVDALLEEGHGADELAGAVQAFARSGEPAECFGVWVRSRSRLRTYWIKD